MSSGCSTPWGTGVDLTAVVRKALASAADGWQLIDNDPWCVAAPDGRPTRRGQGWKLHVSATPLNAGDVLATITPVLATQQLTFKFARTTSIVRWLTGRDCSSSEFGKVVTVYPTDDQTLAELAAELDTRTSHLTGPRILSDRALRPGSLVHYRFGGFGSRADLDNDGVLRYLLVAPDGTMIPDERHAWFSQPAWAGDPFAPHDEAEQRDDGPAHNGPAHNEPAHNEPARESASVLLAGRYVVRAALRHSAKGGVYLAREDATGADVVIKQAHAHAETGRDGQDARDRLRHEAQLLRDLSGHAPVPDVHEVFDHDGDCFLVQELIQAEPLRVWVSRQVNAVPLDADTALSLARKLVEVVGAVHAAGIVLRDLSPTNILIDADQRLYVVDLEHAVSVGAMASGSGTPAYRAPEATDPWSEVVVERAEDWYSLGALIFLLLTGTDPLLAGDDDPARPAHERLGEWLSVVAVQRPAIAALIPVVRGLLMDTDRRWSLERAGEFLRSAELAMSEPERETPPSLAIPPSLASPTALLRDGIEHVRAGMLVGNRRLWPATGGVRHECR